VIHLYFEISLIPAVFGCLTNAIAPPPIRARELFKGSNRSASLLLLVCTQKQNFLIVSCRFFVSDVISEVVLGPFWLMLPGLGPNR